MLFIFIFGSIHIDVVYIVFYFIVFVYNMYLCAVYFNIRINVFFSGYLRHLYFFSWIANILFFFCYFFLFFLRICLDLFTFIGVIWHIYNNY